MNLIKEYFKIRIQLFKAIITYSFQIETAYIWNNWGNILSTTAYAAMQLVFFDVLFSNFDEIGGYARNEMMLFFLMTQFWFFISIGIFSKNIKLLISDVLSGDLDLILIRPLPAMYYISFRQFNIYSIVRDGFLPFLLVIVSIKWSELNIDTYHLFIGVLIFILGAFISTIIHFLIGISSFWLGDANDLLVTAWQLEDGAGGKVPFESWGTLYKIIFTFIFPALIVSAISTSVILGKSDPNTFLLISFTVAVIFKLIQNIMWTKALKHYSSASS